LFFKIESEYWKYLKSFIVFLDRLEPDTIPHITPDEYCLEELSKI
jgi:hypothetical protein